MPYLNVRHEERQVERIMARYWRVNRILIDAVLHPKARNRSLQYGRYLNHH